MENEQNWRMADPALRNDRPNPPRQPLPTDGEPTVFVIDGLDIADRQMQLLTARELQIATLVCFGRLNKQIAAHLKISEHTVNTHLRRVYSKLGVNNRAAMVFRCAAFLERNAQALPRTADRSG
ncbi:response regulator transcription factor [Pseudomonas indica]|uniref:response regulator transcription factor n=1 Tax=Pseudomonas indica TaxID=137658 RepID=UPI0023F6D8D5|nr:helix-turn-helix transcriptional regulator [Pseudomonas indica]MBU3056547.1 helix-turn-helix transcriptional regulator [Pseudomonas indica]